MVGRLFKRVPLHGITVIKKGEYMKPTMRSLLVIGITLLVLLYLASYIPIVTIWGYRVHTAGLVLLGVVDAALIINWIKQKRKNR